MFQFLYKKKQPRLKHHVCTFCLNSTEHTANTKQPYEYVYVYMFDTDCRRFVELWIDTRYVRSVDEMAVILRYSQNICIPMCVDGARIFLAKFCFGHNSLIKSPMRNDLRPRSGWLLWTQSRHDPHHRMWRLVVFATKKVF